MHMTTFSCRPQAYLYYTIENTIHIAPLLDLHKHFEDIGKVICNGQYIRGSISLLQY